MSCYHIICATATNVTGISTGQLFKTDQGQPIFINRNTIFCVQNVCNPFCYNCYFPTPDFGLSDQYEVL